MALTLPEGYGLEPLDDSSGNRVLVLKRPDGSAAAAFEFSALGPDPRRIWQIAWDDAGGSSGRSSSESDD